MRDERERRRRRVRLAILERVELEGHDSVWTDVSEREIEGLDVAACCGLILSREALDRQGRCKDCR